MIDARRTRLLRRRRSGEGCQCDPRESHGSGGGECTREDAHDVLPGSMRHLVVDLFDGTAPVRCASLRRDPGHLARARHQHSMAVAVLLTAHHPRPELVLSAILGVALADDLADLISMVEPELE